MGLRPGLYDAEPSASEQTALALRGEGKGSKKGKAAAQKWFQPILPNLTIIRNWFATQPDRAAKFTLPKPPVFIPRTPPELPLATGLYLTFAPAAGGKTLTALGLACWLEAYGTSVSYEYAYEPGAQTGIDKLGPVAHQELLSRHKKEKPHVLVFDSLSLALRMLPEVEALAKLLGDQAYTGGLKPADLAGAGKHNAFGELNNVCIIGTVNSDMLPIVRALSGAIMGIFTIGAPGTLSGADRTDRTQKPIVVPDEFMNIATQAVGYGEFNARAKSAGRV